MPNHTFSGVFVMLCECLTTAVVVVAMYASDLEETHDILTRFQPTIRILIVSTDCIAGFFLLISQNNNLGQKSGFLRKGHIYSEY